MEKKLSVQVEKLMKDGGADLFAILPIADTVTAESGYQPSDVLPGAKFVIVYGVRQFEFPRLGIVEDGGLHQGMVEYTANFFIVANLLDHLAYRTACLINDHGYQALPINSGPPYDGRKLRGLVSHKYMAELAGLTERGISGVTISERFGPRIRIGCIITNAALTPLTHDKPHLCDPDKCDDACIKACPVNAISRTKLDLNACDRFNEIIITSGPLKTRCGRCLYSCPVGKAT